MSADTPEAVVTLTSEDGRQHACRVLTIFDFEEKEYALLQRVGEGDGGGGAGTPGADVVLMQFIEQEGQPVFRTIESDDEFERVIAYVKAMASGPQGSG